MIKEKIKKAFFRKEFFNSSLVSFSNFFVGGINFLFHIAMQRMLGPEKYGVIYPLIILSLFISLIPSTFQFVITREVSVILHNRSITEAYDYIKNCFFYLSISAILLVFIYFLFLPLMKIFFHIKESIDFYYLIVMTVFPFFINPFISFVQAREKFFFYTVVQIIPTLIKLISGIMIVYFTSNYLGVIASFIIGGIFTLLLLILEFNKSKRLNKTINSGQNSKFHFLPLFISFLKALPAISGFIIISNVDSLIVRFALPELSGTYSSVSVIGKASFYVALSVSTVFLPILSKSKDIKNANRLAILFLTIFLAGFLGLVFVFSPFISSYVLKNQYPGFESLLPYYSIVFIPYAYITYFVNYYVISKKKIYEVSVFVAILLEIILIIFFCKNLFQVANVIGIIGLFVILVLLIEVQIERIFVKTHIKTN